MQKILILILTSLFSVPNSPCDIDESVVLHSLTVMNTKKILNFDNDILELRIADAFNANSIFNRGKVKIHEKDIFLSRKNQKTQVMFKSFCWQDKDTLKIIFEVNEGGYNYDGWIYFKCSDKELYYYSIHYISSIESKE